MTLSAGVLLPLSGPQSAPSASQRPADLGLTQGQGADSRRASLSFSFTPTKFCGECFWCRWKSQIRGLLSALVASPVSSNAPCPLSRPSSQLLPDISTPLSLFLSSSPWEFQLKCALGPLPPALEASLSLQGCLRLPAMPKASLPLGAPNDLPSGPWPSPQLSWELFKGSGCLKFTTEPFTFSTIPWHIINAKKNFVERINKWISDIYLLISVLSLKLYKYCKLNLAYTAILFGS